MVETIRRIIEEEGRLAVAVASLEDDTNLYDAGLTSHASVNLMLALEDAFDIEFPDEMLQKQTFESIAAIRASLEELVGASIGPS
ncbi:MAG TPA: acyl carrier protein [Kofleriaceae bacterium]|nr:acyl carrier protein [Kofleriaceae bacterium]